MKWVGFGPLGLTAHEYVKLTPYELINLYAGYIWRNRQAENMIASLVTVWIANTAGKTLKRPMTVAKIFKDGRFKKSVDPNKERRLLQEIDQ